MHPELLFLIGNVIEDLKERQIHLPFTGLFVLLGLIRAVLIRRPFSGMAAAVLPGAVLFLAAFASRGGIGPGDGLMTAVLGLFLPLEEVLLMLAISFLCAGLYAGALLMRRRGGGTAFPFAPFLMSGYLLAEGGMML